MARRRIEPVLWLLFSSGGVVAALAIPVLVVLFGVLLPLDWIGPPSYDHISAVAGNWLTRIVLLGVSVLALFHWAHRFRYTLYDGLQLKHLGRIITPLCYGGAVAGSLIAAYVLFIDL